MLPDHDRLTILCDQCKTPAPSKGDISASLEACLKNGWSDFTTQPDPYCTRDDILCPRCAHEFCTP